MLKSLLRQNRDSILDRWLEAIVATYPANTASFLRDQEDRFSNPVGHALKEATGAIVDGLIEDAGADALARSLDEIIRIRSVQDYTASQAVSFVFLLKQAVRDTATEAGGFSAEDLARLEARVDDLALTAFDVYMRCREQLYEIRSNEVRKRTHLLLERTGLFNDSSG